MSKFVSALGALGIALLSGPAVSAATPLDPSPDAKGRSVVNAVFRDYLSQLVGVQVQTAVVDVEGDGVAEIVARFVHTSSCRVGMTQCRTVVIRYDSQKWGVILDRPSDVIDIPKPTGRWNFGEIAVDGAKWNWNGKAYAPVLAGVGSKVDFARVPAATVGPIAVAFGAGAVKLAASPDNGIAFEFARPRVSEKGDHIIVRMTGKVACGDVVGCPVRLLEKDGDSWRTIMEGSSFGDVAVSRVARDGRADLVLGTKKGYVVMGWTGKSYGIADTVEATASPGK